MSHFGSGVEIGLHCLLFLVPSGPDDDAAPSARDMADFQGVSPSFTAKIFTQLEKAGIVRAAEGVRGGFALARPAGEITVLDVADAIEGEKPLFQCRDIRDDCVLYRNGPPKRPAGDLCTIHRLMLDAEARMRETLAETTLADLADTVAGKIPKKRQRDGAAWFQTRLAARGRKSPNKETRT
jgi:Rrf2 family protein